MKPCSNDYEEKLTMNLGLFSLAERLCHGPIEIAVISVNNMAAREGAGIRGNTVKSRL